MRENLLGAVLVVDDDPRLQRSLALALAEHATEIRLRGDAGSAVELLQTWRPEFVLLDVALPDGSAFDVIDALRQRAPTPWVIAMSGVATAVESFRLAQLGVRAFVTKPFDTCQLLETMRRVAGQPPDMRSQARSIVGLRSIRDVENEIRSAMLDEALARSRGNRRRAARLLGMSRQLLQYLLRRSAT